MSLQHAEPALETIDTDGLAAAIGGAWGVIATAVAGAAAIYGVSYALGHDKGNADRERDNEDRERARMRPHPTPSPSPGPSGAPGGSRPSPAPGGR